MKIGQSILSYEMLKFHRFSQNISPNIDLISELIMSLPHNSQFKNMIKIGQRI